MSSEVTRLPLAAVAQVVLHGVWVVEVNLQVREHQDRGEEEENQRQTHIMDDMRME